MPRRAIFVLAAVLAAVTLAAPASADTNITDRTYDHHDGGTDPSIVSCNSDATDASSGGERQQNEPTAAVDPLNVNKMTAGANDYCAVPRPPTRGPASTTRATAGQLGQQPLARIPDRHVG